MTAVSTVTLPVGGNNILLTVELDTDLEINTATWTPRLVIVRGEGDTVQQDGAWLDEVTTQFSLLKTGALAKPGQFMARVIAIEGTTEIPSDWFQLIVR